MRNTADARIREKPGWSTVTAWLDSRGAADTQEHYGDAFVLFWTWALENPLKNDPTITNPDQWVQHRIAELRKENLEQYHCETTIIEPYYHFLIKRKPNPVSDGTAKTYLGVISSFLKHATRTGLNLSRLKFGKMRARTKYLPSQEDLAKLRRYCPPLTWALVASMASSGLGPNQLTHIRWGQVEKRDDKYWIVSGQREKTGEQFVTFFGPQAVNAIEAAYYVNGVAPTTDGRAPIFLNEYKQPFTGDAVAQRIKRAIVNAGFHRVQHGEVIEEFSAYSLRVFFNTALERARVPENWRKKMMGHSLGAVQGAYSRPDVETLLAEYKKAYKELSVEGSTETATERQVREVMFKDAIDKATTREELLHLQEEITKKLGSGHSLVDEVGDKLGKMVLSASDVTNFDKSKPKKGQRMIIDASEIGNHCNHGWKAVFQFQDGRVQVEYEGEDAP